MLLLDEPLSALDAKVRLQLREQIRSLQRLGITTLFVTHDQEEALSMADRVAVMKDGKFEQVAVPDQLHAEPQTAFRGRVRRHDEPAAGRTQAGEFSPGASVQVSLPGRDPVLVTPR